MLKQHKNALFETIIREGFDLAHFYGEDVEPPRIEIPQEEKGFIAGLRSFFLPTTDHRTPVIISRDPDPFFAVRLKNSPLYFGVKNQPDSFDRFHYKYNAFLPNYPGLPWEPTESLDKLLQQFSRWLRLWAKNYIAEAQAPDLWLQQESYQAATADSINNETTAPFSDAEKSNLRASIAKFRSDLIDEFQPTPDEEEIIDAKLDYLSRAVDRLNRFDWRALAITIVISIGVNLSVDTERGRLLMKMFEEALASTIKLLR